MTRTARGRRGNDGAAKRARTTKRPPDSTATAAETSAPSSPKKSGLWNSFLHDRSVRSRLSALILLPLLTTVVLGALFFKNSLDEAASASRVEDLANIGITASELLHRLQDERDITALVEAEATGAGELSEARDATDAAQAKLEEELAEIREDSSDPLTDALLVNYDRQLRRLPDYRSVSDQRLAPFRGAASTTYHRVAEAIQDIVTLSSTAVDDPDLARLINAQSDITEAGESASMERGIFAYYIAPGQKADATQQEQAAIFQGEQDLLLSRFTDAFPPDESRIFSNRIIADSRAASSIRSGIDGGFVSQTTKDEWYAAATTRLDTLRSVEAEVGQQVVDEASSAANSARTTALLSAAGVLLVLGLTVALAIYVARSIVGPLRRLRAAAIDAATTSLPSLVDRIRQDGPAAARQATDAVAPEGRDEIGQVATAFNDVHSTAVGVAADQALLRQNLDTIVVNLSRRTQSLIDRQLGEIERLESRERDPDQLSTLFRIDHMATRVRRHAESLMVLAGVADSRQQRTAAPVLDVVRTAVGEVEQYPRVRFGVMPSDLVAPAAADDVAHVLAELIDNATEFSAPSTPVHVTSQPLLGGGLRLEVTDAGLGIPGEQLATLNARLTDPGDIDVAASRTLGLYVVARLANKHGIRVHLEPGSGGGTVAQVDLPSHLVLSPLDTSEGLIPAVTDDTDEAAAIDPGTPFLPPRPVTTSPETTSPSMPSPLSPASSSDSSGQVPELPVRPTGPTPSRELPQRTPHPPLQPQQSPQQPAEPPQRNPQPAPQHNPQQPPQRRPDHEQPMPVARTVEPLRPIGDTGPPRSAPPPASSVPQSPAARSSSAAPPPAAPPPAAPLPLSDESPWSRPATDEIATNGTGPVRRPAAPASPAPSSDLTRREPARPSLRAPEPELPEGDSPIYESIRSAWFNKSDPSSDWSSPADAGWRRAAEALKSAEEAASARRIEHAQRDTAPIEVEAPRAPAARSSWTTGGDAGPAAAEEPALSSSGLPVRRRGASLVPGSIGEAGRSEGARRPAPARPQDAGTVASTLASLQRGVSRGREETGGWVPKKPSDPEGSNT